MAHILLFKSVIGHLRVSLRKKNCDPPWQLLTARNDNQSSVMWLFTNTGRDEKVAGVGGISLEALGVPSEVILN